MFDKLTATYKGKKVFITGHTGFKGAWLSAVLQMMGAKIKGYALAPKTENDLFTIMQSFSDTASVIGDIRDRETLQNAILSFQPDYIFHLAAQPLVRLSYEIPAETFEVNAIGTAYVLDAARLLKNACQIVLITTDKVYHNNEWSYPYRETDRLGGYDPYSASKACAELLIDSYRNSFFHRDRYDDHQKAVAVARAGNVIGGGDWSADRLMPDIARALGKNSPIIVRNPESVRPWQHVLEPLAGYLLLGQKITESPQRFSFAYNFGPYMNDSLPVKEMIVKAINHWGAGTVHHEPDQKALHEAGLLKLDISKTVAEIGWQPKLTAEAAVGMTIEWYKAFYNEPSRMKTFTEEQINTFFDRG